MDPVTIISIAAALVYLALLGVALAAAAWIGGRLFRQSELTFRRLLPVGLVQGLVAGFSLPSYHISAGTAQMSAFIRY